MNKKYYLYELVNPENNDPFYVGITNNPKKRLKGHCYLGTRQFKTNPFKAKIIFNLKTIGLKPIMNILISNLLIEEAKKLEIETIFEYRKKYGEKITNISDGGDLILFNKETRVKIGNSLRGKKLTQKHKDKISESNKGKNKGKKFTEETKHKISESKKRNKNWLGKKHSQETIKKLKELNSGKTHPFYGKKFSDLHKKNLKLSCKTNQQLIAINLKTNEEYFFNSIKECSNSLGISRTNIIYRLNEKYKSPYRKIWIFKKIFNKNIFHEFN